MTELLFGDGVVTRLGAEISAYPDPVVVLTGDASYQASGAAVEIDAALAGRHWQRVVVASERPGRESAATALQAVAGSGPRTVVAVGGGTVIDTAKLVGLGVTNGGIEPVLAATAGELNDGLDLIAIPTTAGSGSERTPFAVAYVDSVKRSIEHESIRPRLAIVDPVLTYSMSREVTVSSGFDALSHALESLWSVQATPESMELSRQAFYLAWTSLSAAATEPTAAIRRVMAEASTTAGAAIATARTTAAHAISYHLSVAFGVPHGLAVALTLGALLEFNAGVGPDSVAHPGGVEKVRGLVSEICQLMGASSPQQARTTLHQKMSSLGAPIRLSDIGLTTVEQLSAVIGSVNEQRLANNPRRIGDDDLRDILEGIR